MKISNSDLPEYGIYLLEFCTNSGFKLKIKKFSDIEFPSGWYYYVGSAQKNLQHRIARHMKPNKKIHWHIDHITTCESLRLKSIYIFPGSKSTFEWRLANDLIDHLDCGVIVKGFGNSDTNKTETHLVHRDKRIYFSHFISRYQSIVRFRPSSIEIS